MNFALPFEADLDLAHQLADMAREISLARFRRTLRRRKKADGSLVTDADEEIEDTLRHHLATQHSGAGVLGEERGPSGSSTRRWIIDAIDGTEAFAAGLPGWSTLIALEIDKQIVVSVCDRPAIDHRQWAARGAGAFSASAPFHARTSLKVSDTREIASARSYVPPPRWLPNERARRLARILSEVTAPLSNSDQPTFDVANGECDLVVLFQAGPWDVAGPSLVVEEAGGRFSDLAGRHDITNGSAVLSNGHLHDAVLNLLAAS